MATGKEEEVAEVFVKSQVLLWTIEKEDERIFDDSFLYVFVTFPSMSESLSLISSACPIKISKQSHFKCCCCYHEASVDAYETKLIAQSNWNWNDT